ncbi:MAG: acyl-CoA thioesterase [Clostridiales bacterium]|nr:acyl-CoA thioesterase [Clostridiales bacterium]
MERAMKRIGDSYTEQVQIIFPKHGNGMCRLFGGQLMAWIDVVAGVVARRHAGSSVTTASVDELSFVHPARVDDTIVLTGRVTHVGRTSMEVRVDTYVERLDGCRELVNRAYLVLVALGADGRPREVPGLVLETDEERAEWAAGGLRKAARAGRRGVHG